jgi:putative transcriptional regulator
VKNSVRTHRNSLGLTQAQLADHLHVSRQTIIAIEQGRFDPALRLAFALSSALDVDINDLFDPAPERNPS